MGSASYYVSTLTANGGAAGLVTVVSTAPFVVDAYVSLAAMGVAAVSGKILSIDSATTMTVSTAAGTTLDLSAFLTADDARIVQPEQEDVGGDIPFYGDIGSGSGGGVTSHGDLTGLGANDHTQYQLRSEKAATSGYASLDSSTLVPVAQLATGSASSSTYLRGDRTWATVSGGGVSDHGGLTGLGDDDHTQYQLRSEKAAAGGYASLDGGVLVPVAQMATGSASSSSYLRGDRTWTTFPTLITAHSALSGLSADDHAQYQLRTEKGATSGYASLDGSTLVPTAQVATGTATSSTYLRGDRVWTTFPTLVTAHSALSGLSADDHPQYQLVSGKAAASGYASLDSSTLVPTAQVATGTATSSTYLRGDRTWTTFPTLVTAHSALTGLSADDHPQYQLVTGKAAANGYASLNSSTLVPTAQLGTGTANSSAYLRGDSTWAAFPTSPTGSGTTNQLAYWSSSSVLTSMSKVTAVSGSLHLADDASTTAASSGSVTIHSSSVAGRSTLSWLDDLGFRRYTQEFNGYKKIFMWTAQGDATTSSTLGFDFSATGTATYRQPTNSTIFTQARRIGYVSSASASSQSGIRHGIVNFTLGNTARKGGFLYSALWGVSDAATVADSRVFVGFANTAGTIGTGEPSTAPGHHVAFLADSTDNNLQFACRGAGSVTKVDLGASFPAKSFNTDLYRTTIFAPPMATAIGYHIINFTTGAEASGTVTTNLPGNNTLMGCQVWRGNGATALAVGIDVSYQYLETDA